MAEKLSFADIFKMAKEENVKLELHCLIGTRPVRGLIKSLNFNSIRPDICESVNLYVNVFSKVVEARVDLSSTTADYGCWRMTPETKNYVDSKYNLPEKIDITNPDIVRSNINYYLSLPTKERTELFNKINNPNVIEAINKEWSKMVVEYYQFEIDSFIGLIDFDHVLISKFMVFNWMDDLFEYALNIPLKQTNTVNEGTCCLLVHKDKKATYTHFTDIKNLIKVSV
ncbi:hypothetical protein PAZH1_348 [Pseudomonas phage PA_ZH1]|uniref:Uncharacterized protein n=2 Tax=Phikzvirus TaxID=680115 RepID=A0AAE7V7Q2_9CAUD|nr:hypothetical protein KTN4_351 [Pseudomonas phage KTN4]QXN68374.1 hypothetical protein [Pseudomonas phage PA7]WPJ69471.1 hypothetical protein PAZH1_348 [Pseudomonas phage PA_ZH1]